MQRGNLKTDGSISEGAPEQSVEKDKLSPVEAGAWFGEAIIETETHFCQKLLDILTEEIVLH